MNAETLAALERAGERLASLATVGHPLVSNRDAGRVFADAVRQGTPPQDALRDAGAPESVALMLEQVKPDDLGAALTSLALVMSRRAARTTAIKKLALQPLLLMVAVAAVTLLVHLQLTPALRGISAVKEDPWSGTALVMTCIGWLLLAWGAAAAWTGGALFPLRRARLHADRAVLTGAATTLLRHGAPLNKALTAASSAVTTRSLAAAARDCALSLEHGEVGAASGEAAFGKLGAAVLASSARAGEALAALSSVAELHEHLAETELPGDLLRAELILSAVGGLTVLWAGIGCYSVYAAAFGGAP